MPTRLQLTTARRQALVAQSQALRLKLLVASQDLRGSLGAGQLRAGALRALTRHPLLTIGIALATVWMGPRRLLRFASLGLAGWSLVDRLRRLAEAIMANKHPR